MEDVSIMGMITGFLPTSADLPPPRNPTDASTERSGPAAGAASASASVSVSAAAAAAEATGSPTAGHGGAATCRRVVHMICFSKDRAFQLDQLLESSKRHLQFVHEMGRGCAGEPREPDQLRVSVLYVASAAPSPDAAPSPGAPDTAGKVGVPEEVLRAAGPGAAPCSSGSGRTMEESYAIVRRRHPDVRFVRERPGEFCDQLRSLVREEAGDPAPETTGGAFEGGEERFVLFAVDDMFFYHDFELPVALELLSTDPSTFCVHLRLHPGITWSHTSDAPCHVPPLSPSARRVTPPRSSFTVQPSGGIEGEIDGRGFAAGERVGGAPESDGPRERQRRSVLVADFGLLTFTRQEGTGEWDYPWDLTGGLYRCEDAAAVIEGIVSTFGKQAAANPNLLEYHGHVLLQRERGLQPISAGVSSPSAETSGRDAAHGGHNAVSVLPLLSESSCLNPWRATAATDPTIVVAGSSPSSQSEDPHLSAPPKDLDSVPPSSAPPGTSAFSVAGASLSAAVNTAKAAPRCGCSGRAVVSSIAVNRVQSTYSTPVYASPGGGIWDLDRRLRPPCRPLSPGAAVGRKDGAVGEKEKAVEEGAQNGGEAERDVARGRGWGGLDGQAYRRRVFNSVHVGELWFEGDGAPESNGGANATDITARHDSQAETGSANNKASGKTEQPQSPVNTLTVLLPVRNGGDHLIDAVESVFSCAREMGSGWCVDLLIVDDGSEDGAVERAVAAFRAWRSESGVAIRVLRHERSLGLAESLNEGLREARGDLVARMDADDICMPGRLKQQVAFMLLDPRISVLGTSVATFSGTTIREGDGCARVKEDRPLRPPLETAVRLPVSTVQRIARHPTDPGFLAWSMLFSCCLAHPSVMLRRDRVLEVGGYDPNTEPAEDYDLWLRMQSSAPGCVENLGEVLLGLRKHDQNVSRKRRSEQVEAADAVAARMMARLLTGQGRRREVTPAQAAVIRRPEAAASPGDLADAARLLGNLGTAAVAAEAVEPGTVAGAGTRALATKAVARSSDVGNSCDVVGDLHQQEGAGHESEQRRRGNDMIARDIEARLGAMGVHAMSRFGAGAAPVLDEWRKRFPDRPLLLSLTGGC
eukprot:g10042.t1